MADQTYCYNTKPMGGDERRQHDRTPITLLVEYPGAEEMAQDYTANLSVGGTFVYTDKDLPPGTPVDFVLSFPGLLRPIQLTGVVRWAGTEPGSENKGVGVQFLGHDQLVRERIQSLLSAIAAGDSRFIDKTHYRILMIEDNPHLGGLVARGLAQYGKRYKLDFEVDLVPNGAEAMPLLDEVPYDVLVVDIYTPVMSGTEFIMAVRERQDQSRVPIIAMSGGRGDEKDIAKEAGSDAFIPKPFRLKDLLFALAQIVDGVPSPNT